MTHSRNAIVGPTVVTDMFLNCIVGGDEVVWSESHDMAVELLIRRREGPEIGQRWDVQEFKVWKGLDPNKPRWASRGFCCRSWADADELRALFEHNDPALIVRVAPV